MEIELSSPNWLQKVFFVIITILLLSSLSSRIVVSSLLTVDGNKEFENTSTLSAHPVPKETEEGRSYESPDKYQINERYHRYLESYAGKIVGSDDDIYRPMMGKDRGEDSLEYEGPSNEELRNEEPSSFRGTHEEWFEENVHSMILAREEGGIGDETFHSIVFNETFWMALDCEDFFEFSEPPNFIEFIPPPPIPPFLMETEITLKKMSKKEPEIEREIIFDDQFCSLCSWASEGYNWTAAGVISSPKKAMKGGISHVMIGILIGVALLSATVGAAVMGIFVKCKKIENSSNERASCPLVLRRRWLNSPLRKNRPHNSGSDNNQMSGRETLDGSGGIVNDQQQITAISLNMTRSSTSTSPLQAQSPESENSGRSEDHYISAETGSSVVYAELASLHPNNHHYSEIDETYHLPNLVRSAQENLKEDSYENFGYVFPEIAAERFLNGGSSSMYSSNISAPSSAYYSDISSSNDAYELGSRYSNNSRSKRKRKGNAKLKSSNEEESSNGNDGSEFSRPVFPDESQIFVPDEVLRKCSVSCDNKCHKNYLAEEGPLRHKSALEASPQHRHRELIYRIHSNEDRGTPFNANNVPYISAQSPKNNNEYNLWHVYELQSRQGSALEGQGSAPNFPRTRMTNSYKGHLRNGHNHRISSVPSEYI